jgi:hypothetical protein
VEKDGARAKTSDRLHNFIYLELLKVKERQSEKLEWKELDFISRSMLRRANKANKAGVGARLTTPNALFSTTTPLIASPHLSSLLLFSSAR